MARSILARFDADAVVAYLALSPAAAGVVQELHAIVGVEGERMLWLSTSLLATAYRTRWAAAPGRECILACRFTKEAFDALLVKSVPSQFDATLFATKKSWQLATRFTLIRHDWLPLPEEYGGGEGLLLGIRADALKSFSGEWLHGVDDVTARFVEARAGFERGEAFAGDEAPYPLPAEVGKRLGLG